MITIKQTGDFKNTERLLSRAQQLKVLPILQNYGKKGVAALAIATPKDTGKTATSWEYRTKISPRGYSVEWYNTHEENGIMPAILIQYGHGTGTGGYVQGVDYINPAMKPIFDEIANAIWKEVSNL